MSAIEDIAAERQRQLDVEGWNFAHDDVHNLGELAYAAAAYAVNAASRNAQIDIRVGRGGAWFHGGWASLWCLLWPWDTDWWKPKDSRRDLVRAGALIVAEIERLDRATNRGISPSSDDR